MKGGSSSSSTYRQILAKGMTSLNPESETLKLPSRNEMINRLKNSSPSSSSSSNAAGVAAAASSIANAAVNAATIMNKQAQTVTSRKSGEYDLLIIGGGATGAGAALDAISRGLKVACIEREDFSSGTSSRSTKLLWGGSRYLVQAFVNLLSINLILSPISTIKRFYHEFRMVLHCHKERIFMLEMQCHLAKWVPIAVPLTSWLLWPPPFNFIPAAVGPLGIFPLFFKFYDALCGFRCPPSHIMTAKRAERKFPELNTKEMKYCSVFYEGIHDDARTNLAIAQTAAMKGADIVNYCEVISFLKEDPQDSNLITGAMVRDYQTKEVFPIYAKSILFCGGPFTDELRKLEDEKAKEAVTGASGIHIVLPNYYNPTGIGLVDMNTSDGRFLFFLPWNGHVLIGTTDHKCKPDSRPIPAEEEIQWLLHEASKYLSPELQLRRKDVLSAWSGIRPLASDPYASSTASASRDHVISYNPKTGITFISGGKWTTFRQMAEEAVDSVLKNHPRLREEAKTKNFKESNSINIHFIGFEGYTTNLPIRLIQTYGISPAIASRLSEAYGGRAHDILKIAKEELTTNPFHQQEGKIDEKLLIKGFPILEAEVIFATRYEWILHAEDFLSRRCRLAFVNRNAAIAAIPRVVELMGQELQWDDAMKEAEKKRCIEFMHHIGGTTPLSQQKTVRMHMEGDILDAFNSIDKNNRGYLLIEDELILLAELLNYRITSNEIEDCLNYCQEISSDKKKRKEILLQDLINWWNSERLNPGLKEMKEKMANPTNTSGSGTMFG